MPVNLKLRGKRRFLTELLESMSCKDEILDELRKIRHEYNNMLQSIVCYIEEKDWDGLTEYKSEMLSKADSLNRNSFSQLAKIKNAKILCIVHKMLVRAKKSGMPLNLCIYNDINGIRMHEPQLCTVLQEFLLHACQEAANGKEDIYLKIGADEQGLRFAVENRRAGDHFPRPFKTKLSRKMRKYVFFNTSVQNDRIVQEFLISFTD